MAKNIKKTVEEIAQPIAGKMGCIYVDADYAKQGQTWTLTVYIDKKGGVTLEDCEAVSRAVEAELDTLDPIDEPYCLCVSSPGLDRPLKKPADFERAMGEKVEVRLYKPFEGKKEFVGELTGYTNHSVTIETEESEIVFELDETAKISLYLDF